MIEDRWKLTVVCCAAVAFACGNAASQRARSRKQRFRTRGALCRRRLPGRSAGDSAAAAVRARWIARSAIRPYPNVAGSSAACAANGRTARATGNAPAHRLRARRRSPPRRQRARDATPEIAALSRRARSARAPPKSAADRVARTCRRRSGSARRSPPVVRGGCPTPALSATPGRRTVSTNTAASRRLAATGSGSGHAAASERFSISTVLWMFNECARREDRTRARYAFANRERRFTNE